MQHIPKIKKGRTPLSGASALCVLSRANRGHAPISREIDYMSPARSVPAAAAARAGHGFAEAPRTYVHGIQLPQAVERLSPERGFPIPLRSHVRINPAKGIDRQGTALEALAVEAGDGLLRLFLVRHLNEAETAGPAGPPRNGWRPPESKLMPTASLRAKRQSFVSASRRLWRRLMPVRMLGDQRQPTGTPRDIVWRIPRRP